MCSARRSSSTVSADGAAEHRVDRRRHNRIRHRRRPARTPTWRCMRPNGTAAGACGASCPICPFRGMPEPSAPREPLLTDGTPIRRGPAVKAVAAQAADCRRRSRWALGVLAIGSGGVHGFDTVARPSRVAMWHLTVICIRRLNIGAAAFVLFRALRARAERWPWPADRCGDGDLGARRRRVRAVGARGSDRRRWPIRSISRSIRWFTPAWCMLMRTSGCGASRPRFRLDALICGLTLGAVAAAIATGPINAAAAGRTRGGVRRARISSRRPVVVGPAAGMLPILGWRAELRWGLLVAGFMSFAVADTFYLFQTRRARTWRAPGSTPAGRRLALIAVAGWCPSAGAASPETRLASYVPAVLCGWSGAGGGRIGQPDPRRGGAGGADPDRGRLAFRRHIPRCQRHGRRHTVRR